MADEAVVETTETPEAATERSLSLLASEAFGSKYVGEVKPEPVEAAEPDDTGPEPQEIAETEEAEPVTDDAAHVDESSDSDDLRDAIYEHLSTNAELLEAIKLPVKVDGESAEATLKDLVNSYQIQQAAEHRLTEAKTKSKSMLEEAQAKSAALDEQFAVASALIANTEKMLVKQTKDINWDHLRKDDPAEYAAKKAEVAEQRERLEAMKQEAVASYRKALETNAAGMNQTLREQLQNEHNALLEKLPEWRDAEKAKTGKAKLAEYLGVQGFSQQDIERAADHRLILMARKAMLYDELQANTNAAKKKISSVPKVTKPGAKKSGDQINQDRVDKARAKLRSSGRLEDAYSLLMAKRGK